MLTHAQIWTAIDRLAARAGLSASGLAKKAGLDPTTFNKSKRITPDGRARWPSTESVAKSLSATDTSVETFIALISEAPRPITQAVPLIGGRARLFRRWRLSGRQGLGRNRLPLGQ
jgi:phage repressor protein C with HTH and peptisase S24 domain